MAFDRTATITMPLLHAAFAAADDELRTDVEPSLVLLTFTDGTRVEADVVIGADGVHSTVRGAATEPSPATYCRMGRFALPTGVAVVETI